jgi:mRNA interferase HigB
MRIIAPKTLKAFWEKPAHDAAEGPMKAWISLTKGARWENLPQVKKTFNSADILPGNRVVFDIGDNTFRIITRIDYAFGIVFVIWVGTHAQYDKIDAKTVHRGG